MDDASLGSPKAKAEEESTRLRLELEQVKANFIKKERGFQSGVPKTSGWHVLLWT